MRAAVKAKWNILLSGGTSSGKTTWLRACLGEVDPSERIMTIEDVLEIRPSQPNAVSLVVNKNASSSDLLTACLRFRPERIIMGELRGAEAYDFLSAINSGHPGGISTLHAASPESALSRLALMVLQADIRSFIRLLFRVSCDPQFGQKPLKVGWPEPPSISYELTLSLIENSPMASGSISE